MTAGSSRLPVASSAACASAMRSFAQGIWSTFSLSRIDMVRSARRDPVGGAFASASAAGHTPLRAQLDRDSLPQGAKVQRRCSLCGMAAG